METREILIATTKDQKRYKINTDAATLGELKNALIANENVYVFQGNQWVANETPIDFSGQDFTEGITNTTLNANESPLPQAVEFRGEMKNPVILLTNTNNKIKSGVGTRMDAYEIIRTEGLQDEIKARYGVNYTVLSNSVLWDFIDSKFDDEDDDMNGFDEEPTCNCKSNKKPVKAFFDFAVEVLDNLELMELNELIASHLDKNEKPKQEDKASFAATNGTISSADLDAMLAKA